MNSYILILSVAGLVNVAFLHWQYRRFIKKGIKMFCVIGGDCGSVVSSYYGKTFGIKNEIYGFLYYLLVIVFSLGVKSLYTVVLIASLVATLFSVRLFYLQSRVLKKYCSWCLVAILINIALFLKLVF